MAAGSAGGDVAVPMAGDYDAEPESIETLRATMGRMSDSINSLSKQVGFLSEERHIFYTRQPGDLDLPIGTTEDEKGPAVRMRMYDRTVQADRTKMESPIRRWKISSLHSLFTSTRRRRWGTSWRQ